MDFLFDSIAVVLAYFYDLTGSFGGAIILLTLAVMVLVTPLTLKSTRSMIAMQQMQPELRKLQAKYKDDRQKLNEEMMAFYKEHNINPMGGCLPLVVQAPVFFVLYRVLLGLVELPGFGEDMGRSAGLFARNMAGGGTYQGFGTFEPGYLSHETALYQALDGVRQMNFVGLDLAESVTGTLSAEGLAGALPYLVLVALIGLTAWYQQKQIQARNAGNQAQVNPQQQMLMKIMPFFLPAISLTLPAGLVLYFLVSNSFRIAQQAFITRTMYGESHGSGDDDAPSRADTVASGSKSLLGGLIQLPGRGDADAKPSNGAKAKTSTSKGASSKAAGSKGAGSKGAGSKGAGSKGSGSNGSGSKGGGTKAPAKGKAASTATKGKSSAKAAGTASRTKAEPNDGGVDSEAAGSRNGNAPARKAPARKAPARKAPAAPANQNRSKKKKKRN